MDTATAEPVNPSAVGGEDDFSTGFDSYWGTDETTKFYFPDGKQFLVIRLMAEGERAKFEKDNNQDLRVTRDGETTIKIDPGRSRQALIVAAVGDWLLVKDGRPFKFSEPHLIQWIQQANPKLIDKLEKAIRDFNEWLKQDLTVEEIDKEIENLGKEREAAVRREAGE